MIALAICSLSSSKFIICLFHVCVIILVYFRFILFWFLLSCHVSWILSEPVQESDTKLYLAFLIRKFIIRIHFLWCYLFIDWLCLLIAQDSDAWFSRVRWARARLGTIRRGHEEERGRQTHQTVRLLFLFVCTFARLWHFVWITWIFSLLLSQPTPFAFRFLKFASISLRIYLRSELN